MLGRDQLSPAGFSPDLVTFNTLVELHARRGQAVLFDESVGAKVKGDSLGMCPIACNSE